jgi:putative Holliday junction resolvase
LDWILHLDFMMRSLLSAPECTKNRASGWSKIRKEPVDQEHQPERPSVGRILGLDVGDRRVGVAVSDELGFTAQPVLTLERKNRKQDLGFLGRLIRKYGCFRVVVGNPLYMSGDVSPQALKAQAFARALQLESGVEVTLWDERLSTTEAHRHLDAAGHQPGKRRTVIDQVAAVLILQSFLDSRR